MTLISALLMILVSLATKNFSKPGAATLARYFSEGPAEAGHYVRNMDGAV